MEFIKVQQKTKAHYKKLVCQGESGYCFLQVFGVAGKGCYCIFEEGYCAACESSCSTCQWELFLKKWQAAVQFQQTKKNELIRKLHSYNDHKSLQYKLQTIDHSLKHLQTVLQLSHNKLATLKQELRRLQSEESKRHA